MVVHSLVDHDINQNKQNVTKDAWHDSIYNFLVHVSSVFV